MAIGRTFKESFQKALRGLEVGAFGFGSDSKDLWNTESQPDEETIRADLSRPNPERVWNIRYGMKAGMSIEEIYELTAIDPWFLDQLAQIVELEEELRRTAQDDVDRALLLRAKQFGFSDRQLAEMWGVAELSVREWRLEKGVRAVFKSVDTCAAEFEAYTPYFLFDLRVRRRNSTQAKEGVKTDHDPGRRSEPHRARASSSTTVVAMPASRCVRWASSRSWSTRTPKRSARTTTPATSCSSSRSPTEDVLNIFDRDAAGWSDRSVRRPNAAEPGPRVGNRRTCRSSGRRSRQSRRPRIVRKFQRLLERLGPEAAGQCDCSQRWAQARVGSRARSAYPCARAAQLRVGWSSHGNLLRPGATGAVCWPRRLSSPRASPSSSTAFSKTPPKWTSTRFQRWPRTSSWRASWSTSKRRASTRAIPLAPFRPTVLPGPIVRRNTQGNARFALAKKLQVVGLDEHPVCRQARGWRGQRLRIGSEPPRQPHGVPFVAKATGECRSPTLAAQVMAGKTVWPGTWESRSRAHSQLTFP